MSAPAVVSTIRAKESMCAVCGSWQRFSCTTCEQFAIRYDTLWWEYLRVRLETAQQQSVLQAAPATVSSLLRVLCGLLLGSMLLLSVVL